MSARILKFLKRAWSSFKRALREEMFHRLCGHKKTFYPLEDQTTNKGLGNKVKNVASTAIPGQNTNQLWSRNNCASNPDNSKANQHTSCFSASNKGGFNEEISSKTANEICSSNSHVLSRQLDKLGRRQRRLGFFGKPSKDCEKSLRASQLFSNESGLEQRPPSSEGQRPTEKRGQNSSQQTRKSSAPIFVAKLSQIEEEESGSASSSESKKGLSILNSNSNFMWDRSSTSTTSKQEQVNDT